MAQSRGVKASHVSSSGALTVDAEQEAVTRGGPALTLMENQPPSDYRLGLPWWLSGWECACQRGKREFSPDLIAQAAKGLSPGTTTPEPVL